MSAIYSITTLFVVVLLSAGCTARGPQAQPQQETSSSYTQSASEQPESESQESASLPQASEETSSDAALIGKYVFHAEGVEDIYSPNLDLREDGTCRFNVNLLTNMGAINGSYHLDDGLLLTIDVDNLSFDGFTGDDTKRVYFEVAGQDKLMYRGTDAGEDAVIGMTNPMDLFEKE